MKNKSIETIKFFKEYKAFFFAFFIFAFAISPVKVMGKSMQPTINDKDFGFVEKVSTTFNNYQRGEIIVFDASPAINSNCIKRVIGLSGDKIKIKNGVVSVNNQIINEPYLYDDTLTDGNLSLTVPEGKLFVLGDHRQDSEDSRDFGCIDKSKVIGHFVFRFSVAGLTSGIK